MADSYSLLGHYNHMDIDETYPKAREFVLEAISRNSTKSDAYVSLGWIQFAYDYRFVDSAKNYNKAIDLDPKNPQAYHWLGINQTTQGKMEEAYLALKKALELDPDNHVILFNFSYPATMLGRYEEATDACHQALNANSNFNMTLGRLYLNYLKQGDKENEIKKLITEIESMRNKSFLYESLLHHYKSKDEMKFNKYLEEAKAFRDSLPANYVDQYLLLAENNTEEYLNLIEEALPKRRLHYEWDRNVFTETVKNNERFKEQVKKFRSGL